MAMASSKKFPEEPLRESETQKISLTQDVIPWLVPFTCMATTKQGLKAHLR